MFDPNTQPSRANTPTIEESLYKTAEKVLAQSSVYGRSEKELPASSIARKSESGEIQLKKLNGQYLELTIRPTIGDEAVFILAPNQVLSVTSPLSKLQDLSPKRLELLNKTLSNLLRPSSTEAR